MLELVHLLGCELVCDSLAREPLGRFHAQDATSPVDGSDVNAQFCSKFGS
jgi:hypothetical protein